MLKHIKNIKDYLLESKSISDITIEYKNTIWKDLSKFINYTIEKSKNYNTIFENSHTFTYTFNNINFLLSEFKVNIILRKYSSNACNGLTDNGFAGMKDDYLYNSKITLEIYFNDLNSDFILYIESVLLHELLHVYQRYCQADKSIDSNWQMGNALISTRKTILNKDVLKITELLYYSIEHEIMSQIHQYFLYKNNNKKYDKIFQILNLLKDFNVSDINISEDFIKNLNILREEYIGRLDYNKPNNTYFRNVSFVWKKEITKDNANKFLTNLQNFVDDAYNFYIKKMKHVDDKLSVKRYDDISESLLYNEILSEFQK